MSEQMYYLQDTRSYVGNSPTWWGLNNSGYVCQIDKAQLYTYNEVMKMFNDRSTDIPWKKEDVENAIKNIVDAQYLKKSDDDGFYSELEKLQKEKIVQVQKEANEYALGEYVKQELFAIYEQICFDDVVEWVDFSIQFDDFKNNIDWHEHYYPTAYNKHHEEIFDDLIKYDYIFKCKSCNKYFAQISKDEEYGVCEMCAEEMLVKDNES